MFGVVERNEGEDVMDSAPVASDLREGERLTATPGAGMGHAVTVWVERDDEGVRVWLRPCQPSANDAAATKTGWTRLSPSEWRDLERCVNQYLAHFLGGAGPDDYENRAEADTAEANSPGVVP